MVQISNNDLPVLGSDNLRRAPMNSSNDSPPGTSSVRTMPNRSTGFYCQACQTFIVPIWLRRGDAVYPTCRTCFCFDLAEQRGDEDVATIEKMVESAETVDPAATSC